MLRPRIHAHPALDESNLQRIQRTLDPALLGNEVVELFPDDGGRDEDVVDGWEARGLFLLRLGRGETGFCVCDDGVCLVKGVLEGGDVGLEG